MKIPKLEDLEELNPRFIMWLFIALVIGCIALYPLFNHSSENMNKTINNSSVNVTPTKIVYVTVLVTPTIDGKEYFASEYQTGVRKLQRPFSFMRDNASGYQTLKVTATAYDYKIFNKYHWFNPVDYKYYEVYPSSGNKFLFVFFNVYLDNIIGQDTRFWLPKESAISVSANGVRYLPSSYSKQIRIQELEETFNLLDNSRVKAYGQYPSYSRDSSNANTAGEISIPDDVLKGGKSNSQDGYILFEIPKSVKEESIYFQASFYSFGSSSWRLKSE